MSARKPNSGSWRGSGATQGRVISRFNGDERPPRILIRRDATTSESNTRFSSPSDSGRTPDEENGDILQRQANGHRGRPQPAGHSSKAKDRSFPPARFRRMGINMEEVTSGSVLRQIQSYDQEAFDWIRSDGIVPKLTLKVVRGMEKVLEQFRLESCNNYSSGIWEADEPVSSSIKQVNEELQFLFSQLDDCLKKPSKDIIGEMAEGFYLIFSILHAVLLNPDIPTMCQRMIRDIVASAALIGMNHGNPHTVLTCTTDHLNDAENEGVLLTMQHVLFKIIDNDQDGTRLFGRAHRILDVQMELFESRDDEATAISALKIIAIISVRHPQAFKTRFGDLMDLFIGWYVDAMPKKRVFEACVSSFALFREKFKQEIDFAMKMVRQFTVEINNIITEFRKVKVGSSEAKNLQQSFLAFTQLTALIFHAVTERLYGTQRASDGQIRATAKSAVLLILKSFNQLSSSSDQDSVDFSSGANMALVVIVQAFGSECTSICSQLYLHARMQQTSASRICDVLRSQVPYICSYFAYVVIMLKSIGEHFPLDVAKDLLGSNSLVFQASIDKLYRKSVQQIFTAVLLSASLAVKEFFVRNFALEYSRTIQELCSLQKDHKRCLALLVSPSAVSPNLRNAANESMFLDINLSLASNPLLKVEQLVNTTGFQLSPEGMREPPMDSNISGLPNAEALGVPYRERCSVFLNLIQLSLDNDQNFEGEFFDGCYHIFVQEIDPSWMSFFSDLVIHHLRVGKSLWKKKCASLVVKDLMSSSGGFKISSTDIAFIQVTLEFLDRMIGSDSSEMIIEVLLDWACDALQTLQAFKSSLEDLGIQEGYLKIISHLFYFAFTRSGNLKLIAVNYLTELCRTQWSNMKIMLTRTLVQVAAFESRSELEQLRTLADTIMFNTPLHIILEIFDDATALCDSIDQEGQYSLLQLLPEKKIQNMPVHRYIKLWKRFVFQHTGSQDFGFCSVLFGMLLGMPFQRNSIVTSQIINSKCASKEWAEIVSNNQSLSFHFASNIVCNYACQNKSNVVFLTVQNLILLIQALFQTHLPVVFDHSSFTHKTLLELYIILKDESLDIVDEWDIIKRLAVDPNTEDNVENESAQSSKKSHEKRRIYSRTAGITAEDVLNPPVTIPERTLMLDRAVRLAETMEKALERICFGSCLHSHAISANEWTIHMNAVKSLYGTEEQLATVGTLLTTLKAEILRVALARNDYHNIVRIGYPILLGILETGESPQGVNTENLAMKAVYALIQLEAGHLIQNLAEVQSKSDVFIGISDLAFSAAKAMAEKRWNQVTSEMLPVRFDDESCTVLLEDFESELATDCFRKLNDWHGLKTFLSSKEDRNERQNDLLFIAECKSFDSVVSTIDDVEVAEKIKHMLRSELDSCIEAAEIITLLPHSKLDGNLIEEAQRLLKESLRYKGVVEFPKFPVRAAIVLHGLSRIAEATNRVDHIQTFPLASKTPRIGDLCIEAQHAACHLLCGEHEFHDQIGTKTDCWDAELYTSVVRFGRRTENPYIVRSYLNAFFSGFALDCDMNGTKNYPHDLLARAADATISPQERELVRQGAKYFGDSEDGHIFALQILHKNCLSALQSVNKSQQDLDENLIQVSRNLKCIERLHRFSAADNEDVFSKELASSSFELKNGIENLYQQSGFPPGMFIDTYSVTGFVNSHAITSGLFMELAYMSHCLEGTYTKPALEFGHWCYDQACQILESLSMLNPEDVITSVIEVRTDLSTSELSHSTVATIISLFAETLPFNFGSGKLRTEKQLFLGNLPCIEDLLVNRFGPEIIHSAAVAAIVDYCQQYSACIMDFLIHAAHLYFVYLRSPLASDYTSVVILRILELLSAYPTELHPIWVDEILKVNITPWKDFVNQLLSYMQHPNPLVTECLILLVSGLLQKHPNELIYPVTVGRMTALDMNLGGGSCYPQCNDNQKQSLKVAFDDLLQKLPADLMDVIANTESFSSEVQRISLLWEERFLHYLLSEQTALKKQLKSAISAGLANHRNRLHRGDSLESLSDEESLTDDASFPSQYVSEMNIDSEGKSDDGFLLENTVVDENLGADANDAPTSSSIGSSHHNTPEITEARKDPKEKRFTKFALHENLPWTKIFDIGAYKSAVIPVLQKFQSLLTVYKRANETQSETEFKNYFLPKIEEVLKVIADPPFRVEFDEEVLWTGFDQIAKQLEVRQASNRHRGLHMDHISKIRSIVSQCRTIPIPGHVASSNIPVFIDEFENSIIILPTKTKPKKLALRGTDGRRYLFLCKGLEDLNQDNRIMQLTSVANRFLDRKFKHSQQTARIRTYSVVLFGPRAGLIQWVEGSTSLLSLYRSYLERQTFLGRQMFPVKDEGFVDTPVYGQLKEQDDRRPQVAAFRVTEEDLQDLYDDIQARKYEDSDAKSDINSTLTEGINSKPGDQEMDLFDQWVDSEEEFSPKQFVEQYYETFLRKSKKDLAKFRKKVDHAVRSHPNIHDLHLSYLVNSLRNDATFNWEHLRRHGTNITKDINVDHLRNALHGLIKATPKELLEREMWLACSSSDEWWKVTRNYTHSLAITSVLGYIVGLGDRHPDNVLFDFETGDVVHVDYNVAFERGLRLNVPERVPYRLTQNLVSALGPEGLKGTFRTVAIQTLESLRHQQAVFASLLSACVLDPMVNWTTDKSDQIGLNPTVLDSTEKLQKISKASLHGSKVWSKFREKLIGVDSGTAAAMEVADQIDRTIAEATDMTNLARMFEGWIAWL